jgi:hypothetical protein
MDEITTSLSLTAHLKEKWCRDCHSAAPLKESLCGFNTGRALPGGNYLKSPQNAMFISPKWSGLRLNFRRLLRLAGKRWGYSTHPPQGIFSSSFSFCCCFLFAWRTE